MKILVAGFVFVVLFILLNISDYHVTDGQYFANSSRSFVPIKFDNVNRGAFNTSQCIKELLNCWELVRGDIMCSYGKHKETICGFFKDNCHDYFGYLDNEWGGKYTLFEAYCQDDGFQKWTK